MMMAKNNPIPKIKRAMAGVMMLALLFRGLSFITSSLGGREAKANAAKVSIIKFTHSIWVTVRAGCFSLRNDTTATSTHAATFTVSWNMIKR